MENGRKLLRWVALAAIAVIGLGGLASLFETSSVAAVGRPDVIRIDAIGQHKALEMPPAVFLHDKHTQALALQGKDCSVCHSETADGHSGFMRWNEESDPKSWNSCSMRAVSVVMRKWTKDRRTGNAAPVMMRSRPMCPRLRP